jgi:DNA-binding transcriptional LysR family regulator
MRVPISLALLALVAAEPASAPSLQTLRFMTGCWRGPAGSNTTLEEFYTAPAANLMLGVSRYVREGKVTDYEFTSIEQRDSDLVITPRPKDQSPASFRLRKLTDGEVVWANPEHDFPQIISYRRVAPDSLIARIEGPGPQGTRAMEWRMARSDCGK